MAIIVKDIKNPNVRICNPEGVLLCETDNELVFNDIRIQIMEQRLSGYYIEFRGEKININNKGELEKWPKGLFELSTIQLNYLFGI